MENDGAPIEFSCLEHRRDPVCGIPGGGVGESLVKPLHGIDDQIAVVASQEVTSLAPKAQELRLPAIFLEYCNALAHRTRDGGVETAAQSAIGGDDNDEVHLAAAGSRKQAGGVFTAREGSRQ